LEFALTAARSRSFFALTRSCRDCCDAVRLTGDDFLGITFALELALEGGAEAGRFGSALFGRSGSLFVGASLTTGVVVRLRYCGPGERYPLARSAVAMTRTCGCDCDELEPEELILPVNDFKGLRLGSSKAGSRCKSVGGSGNVSSSTTTGPFILLDLRAGKLSIRTLANCPMLGAVDVLLAPRE
jgi:hypothetical protein